MEINLDLGLVGVEFDESSVTVDDDMSISGVLHLTGTVDGNGSLRSASPRRQRCPGGWRKETRLASARFRSGRSRAISERSGVRSTRPTRAFRASATGALWRDT